MSSNVTLFNHRLCVSPVQIVGHIIEEKAVSSGNFSIIKILTTPGDEIYEVVVGQNAKNRLPTQNVSAIFTCDLRSRENEGKDGRTYINLGLLFISALTEEAYINRKEDQKEEQLSVQRVVSHKSQPIQEEDLSQDEEPSQEELSQEEEVSQLPSPPPRIKTGYKSSRVLQPSQPREDIDTTY